MESSGGLLLRFSRDGGDVSGIRTNAAAELLGVSPNTLRSWERRFGYPQPRRTQGGHRQYDLTELESLRRALLETHNISSAIEVARQRGEGPSSPSRLLDAFEHFDEAGADRVMEESLAVRSVERTVEEVLLPGVELAQGREGREAEYELACRWATGWLHASRRVVPPASRPQGVLIFDSSARIARTTRSGGMSKASMRVRKPTRRRPSSSACTCSEWMSSRGLESKSKTPWGRLAGGATRRAACIQPVAQRKASSRSASRPSRPSASSSAGSSTSSTERSTERTARLSSKTRSARVSSK